jgi:hypothetical protein
MARSTKRDAYFRNLGIFVHVFAFVEDWMLLLLHQFSNVHDKAAPALFSGLRVDQAISLIRRLYEAHGHAIDPELDHAFRQLATINSTRNDILHYGGLGPGDERIVSTRRAAHTPDRIRVFPVSSKVLDDMSTDLLTIVVAFQNVIQRSRPWLEPPEDMLASVMAL